MLKLSLGLIVLPIFISVWGDGSTRSWRRATFRFIIFKKDVKVSVGLATQINALTPYKFQRFDAYRYTKSINEIFGGQISVSYSIKQVITRRPIFPIVMYRSNYFNTHFGKKIGNTFSSSFAKGFSTLQGFSAGIQAYVGKGFMVDVMAGGGIYIFKDTQVHIEPGEKYGFDVRPDFSVNASLCYMFVYKERKK